MTPCRIDVYPCIVKSRISRRDTHPWENERGTTRVTACPSALTAEGGRASASDQYSLTGEEPSAAFRVKMHHGMGGSAGDRHGAQNSAMQARNGVCDKIENYISELGRWYVSKRGSDHLRRSQEPLRVFSVLCRPVKSVGTGIRGRMTQG